MTLRMTFKTRDFRGVFQEDFEGDLEGDSKGDFRGDFKQDMEVKLRSGKVQVRFSLQPKFNSFELDSEVGRLVLSIYLSITGEYFHHLNGPRAPP